jgi:hypothetical protein
MRVIIVIILSAFSSLSFAQQELQKKIEFDSIKVSDAFIIIEKEYNVKISYTDKIIEGKFISISKKTRNIREILDEFSEILLLNFQFINERYVVVTSKKNPTFLNETNKLNEILIRSYLAKGITKYKNAAFKINPKELEILPGLIEADVLESLQELPGVISNNETATGLYVRGGTPDQNQIIWDGITIYHSGHFFGMVSNFNPNITNEIIFQNKGVNPKYGERISSVIIISTKNSIADQVNVGFGLNGISADLLFETPIIKDKLSLLVSFRKSYHNLLSTSTFEKIEEKVFQSTEIHSSEKSEELFYFKDQTIKLNYFLNKNNNFSFSYIHIDNDLEHYNENLKNTETYKDVLDTENNGVSANWVKKWKTKIAQITTFSSSDFNLNYNFLTFKENKLTQNFEKSNHVKNNSISSEISINHHSGNTTLFGFQSDFKDVSYSFTETSNNLKYILDINKNILNTYSLFYNYSNRTFTFIDFNVGFRTNYYKQLNQFRVEPRITVLKEIFKNLKFQATADIKNQTINQIDQTLISNLSLENKLWRLADADNSPIINSKQITFGLLYDNNGWSFDIDTYFKKNYGISALKYDFLSNSQDNYAIGEQKIKGLDFYLKKDFNSVKTWISYSFTDIKNKFDILNNNEYFTASNQIQHAISSSISYKTSKIQIALGWKWHSGNPYSLSEKNTNNTVFNNGINTGRLPNYNRFDFSSIYHFSFSNKDILRGKIGISIRNLLDENNLISRDYIGNNTSNDPITQIDKFSLRRTTNFVFRIEW